MMANHQVYVIWKHPLVRDSLRQLLDHTNISWVGDASDLIEELEGETSTPAFLEIVEKFQWKLRVVGVSLNDNQLNIYQHEHQTVGHPEDLIRLIVQ
jgi:DNA-binding NarL/FixJ family response regulator